MDYIIERYAKYTSGVDLCGLCGDDTEYNPPHRLVRVDPHEIIADNLCHGCATGEKSVIENRMVNKKEWLSNLLHSHEGLLAEIRIELPDNVKLVDDQSWLDYEKLKREDVADLFGK